MIRKYRLTVMFILTAIVVTTVAAVVVNRIIGNLASDTAISIAEEDTTRLALHIQAMLRDQVLMQGTSDVSTTPNGDTTQDASQPIKLTLDDLAGPGGLLPNNFRMLVEGLGIVKFNLFDLDSATKWSTDPETVDLSERESPLYAKAASGGVSSRLIPGHEFTDLSGASRRVDVIETYLPLRESPEGQVIGVMEIYRDVGNDFDLFMVEGAKSTVMRTTLVTMGGLFVALVGFVVAAELTIQRSKRREIGLIEGQLLSRKRAQALVQKANDELETRVVERTQALSESEERFRRLVENAGDAFFLHDLEGRLIDANQAASDSLGYTLEELLTLSVSDLELNYARANIDKVWKQMTPGIPVTAEGVHRRKDGTTFPVEFRLGMFESLRGPLILALVRDVTGRKRAEETLRESEEEARQLAQENAVLAEISRIIGSSLDIDEVYASFAEQVRKIMPFDKMTICAIDMDRNTFTNLYAVGLDVPERRVGAEIPLAGSFTAEVCRLRSGLLIQGEAEEQFAQRYPGTIPGFQAGLRSFLSVPLVSKNEVTGVLHLLSTEPNAFSENHLALGERIAVQIAGGIANAKLHSELDREAREREVLAEISRIIGSSLDINDVYEQFAEQVRKLIPFDRLAIHLVSLEGDKVITAFSSGMQVPDWAQVYDLAQTTTQEVVRSRSSRCFHPQSIEEVEGLYPALTSGFEAGLRSFLTVPIISNNEVVGVLHLRSKKPNAYKEVDISLAERIGFQIAGSISNAQLYRDLERETKERKMLAEIGRIIGSSLDIDEVYASFAEQVRELIPFDRISITTIDIKAGTFTHPYVAGIEVPGREPGIVHPLADSATEMLVRTRSHLLIGEEAIEEAINRYPSLARGFSGELRSMLAVPLISNNDVIGSLQFRSRSPNGYSERDLALAERVANQIAGAIANAQLHSELDHEAREREALAEIGRLISSSLDLTEVYEPFAEQVRKLIPFDRLVISIPELERGLNIVSYTTGMEVAGKETGVPVPLEGTLAQEILLSRSGVLLQGVSRDYLEEHLPGLLSNFDAGLRSFIGVPLIHHDDVIGVLQIRSREANAYTKKHLALAERIGVQISGAIANTRLYAELRRAEETLRKNEQRIRELATATVRAHEEERQWAAIEVHDRISQTLVGLGHYIQTLESVASGDSRIRPLANRAFELVQQAIGESRNIMNYLYPPGLQEFGIVPLLQADLHRFREDTGNDVTLDADAEVTLPQDVEVTLYRIFQEALTNIRRHATGTKMVTVSLRCADRFVSLEVKDDGAGFDVETSKPESKVGGLMSMSRRAEIIGGTLDISSTPGQGTTVTVHVPIEDGNL